MNEKIINFETAKLAKDKGFMAVTHKYWCNYYSGFPLRKWRLVNKEDLRLSWLEWAAPLQSELRDWLISNYKLQVDIVQCNHGNHEVRIYNTSDFPINTNHHTHKITGDHLITFDDNALFELGLQKALQLIP